MSFMLPQEPNLRKKLSFNIHETFDITNTIIILNIRKSFRLYLKIRNLKILETRNKAMNKVGTKATISTKKNKIFY